MGNRRKIAFRRNPNTTTKKLGPTTTDQLFAQRRSPLQLEPLLFVFCLFGLGICARDSVVDGCLRALSKVLQGLRFASDTLPDVTGSFTT